MTGSLALRDHPGDLVRLYRKQNLIELRRDHTGGPRPESPQQAAVIATSESLLRSSQLRRFGHGFHFSRNARVIWSWKGLTRYETTVRGFVWMKTSTGMPGTSFNPFRRAISASDTLIRTV
jgi:hypothetical protein